MSGSLFCVARPRSGGCVRSQNLVSTVFSVNLVGRNLAVQKVTSLPPPLRPGPPSPRAWVATLLSFRFPFFCSNPFFTGDGRSTSRSDHVPRCRTPSRAPRPPRGKAPAPAPPGPGPSSPSRAVAEHPARLPTRPGRFPSLPGTARPQALAAAALLPGTSCSAPVWLFPQTRR